MNILSNEKALNNLSANILHYTLSKYQFPELHTDEGVDAFIEVVNRDGTVNIQEQREYISVLMEVLAVKAKAVKYFTESSSEGYLETHDKDEVPSTLWLGFIKEVETAVEKLLKGNYFTSPEDKRDKAYGYLAWNTFNQIVFRTKKFPFLAVTSQGISEMTQDIQYGIYEMSKTVLYGDVEIELYDFLDYLNEKFGDEEFKEKYDIIYNSIVVGDKEWDEIFCEMTDLVANHFGADEKA